MAGRRLEVREEATIEIICGSRARANCVGMHTLTEVWGPGQRGNPHFVEWDSVPTQFGGV